MSISKVKVLQGKITKKFKVYTSFNYNQGFDSQKGKFYSALTVYDEVHSHREHKSFDLTIKELERFLAMTDHQFRYEAVRIKTEQRLHDLKEQFVDVKDDISNMETILKEIDLAEGV